MSVTLPINVSTRRMAAVTLTAGQTVIPYNFPLLRQDDIRVTRSRAGVIAELVPGGDFTVSGIGNAAGGTVTLTAGAAAGDIIVVDGDAVISRLSSIIQNGRFSSAQIDLELDLAVIRDQELRRDLDGKLAQIVSGPGISISSDALGNLTITNIGVPDGGSGNVVGPASSVDKRAAAFSGTTGKVLVDSGVGLDTGTVIMTSSFQRNLMVNGDMRVNQRTGFVGSLAAGSTKYGGPDRWFASVLSGTTSLSFVALPANVQGVQNVLRLQRSAGQANTGGLVTGQQIESDVIIPRQGKTCALSFKARAGANFSALGGQITVNCVFGSGINQPSIGAVGSTWTGWNNVAAVRTINTTLTQYTMTVPVPANATEAAVLFSFTPTGTAGAADFMEITEVQLEEGVAVTPFEILPFDVQLAMCRRRWRQAGAGMVGVEENAATLSFGLSFNPPMAATPTISLANTSFAYRYINAAGFGDRTMAVSLNGATVASANGAWVYLNDTSNASAAGRMAIERNGVNYFNVDADL